MCSILPPLSASNIRGFVVTSKISFIQFTLVEYSTDWLSGFPLNAESVARRHMPSNSSNSFFLVIFSFSITNSDKGEWVSKILTFFDSISLFNFDFLISGVVPAEK